jgi:hypothetical protein
VVKLSPRPKLTVRNPSPASRPASDKTAAFLLFLAASSLADFPPPSDLQTAAPVGAKLSLFADRWKASSPYLGAALQEGIWIQWSDGVPNSFDSGTRSFEKHLEVLFDEEVSSLVAKKAISQISGDRAHFVCSLFLVDKKGGGHRPCLNLKPLNVFTRPKHFKM